MQCLADWGIVICQLWYMVSKLWIWGKICLTNLCWSSVNVWIIVSYWVGQHCDNFTEEYVYILLGNCDKSREFGVHLVSYEFQACIIWFMNFHYDIISDEMQLYKVIVLRLWAKNSCLCQSNYRVFWSYGHSSDWHYAMTK